MSVQIADMHHFETTLRMPLERRRHRRYDLETREIPVERWDASRQQGVKIGRLIDISAAGLRLRTRRQDLRPDQQIRIRLVLPDYAGICPFVDTRSDQPRPSREWVGWLVINRVQPVGHQQADVAGQLLEMDELDRAMFKLYLSTQPLAA